ncbi:MAG TPA: hypothetical protein VGI10_21895 [Polyangiaceae bacterium]|jgi:hypothetical protein
MQEVVKGMVRVEGVTYRVVRIRRGSYEVVRILDDTLVGSFNTGLRMHFSASSVDEALLREIARVAIQGAKLSWVGRPAFG